MTIPSDQDDRLDGAGLLLLLADLLAGAAGGKARDWRKKVGTVTVVPMIQSPRSNWSVTPKGTAEERHAIDRAVEVVREQHPYARLA